MGSVCERERERWGVCVRGRGRGGDFEVEGSINILMLCFVFSNSLFLPSV